MPLPSSRSIAAGLLPFVMACSNEPPADLAPNPVLVAQIREIRVIVSPQRACPGSEIDASYEAVLADGTRMPFRKKYDSSHPSWLYMSFLDISGSGMAMGYSGTWVSDSNPLLTVTSGSRLTARLKAIPEISATATVVPDYRCTPSSFVFQGTTGAPGQLGETGPPVTVRIGRGKSPFYDTLIVVGIQVGSQAPTYELYDGGAKPSAGWLTVASRGGRGGAGLTGKKGEDGTASVNVCPVQTGGLGSDGENGGAGATGGRGGLVTIVVPEEHPALAELITAQSPGGVGGLGGAGGAGGRGGQGGDPGLNFAGSAASCIKAADGEHGNSGLAGEPGPAGQNGPERMIVKVPVDQLFGRGMPPQVAALINTRNP